MLLKCLGCWQSVLWPLVDSYGLHCLEFATHARLGRTLIVGGIGYIASTFLNYGGLEYSWIDLLTIPATIGEFWMISYLLIFGIRATK